MSKKFEVTILGVNSAFPVHGRHPSCQVVNFDERLYMIDCGEAAQIQLSRFKIKKSKLDHIFISHLHGDHCYGLPGLLGSLALGGRSEKLYLHGPIGIKKFIEVVAEVSGAYFPFELDIIEYDTEGSNKIAVSENLIVQTFPMKHRLPTMGFRFDEVVSEMNILASKISEYSISIEEIKTIKLGSDILRRGKTILNEELTLPLPASRSYSYCSDTIYDEDLIPKIKGSSLLYHETTYLDDLALLARERMHSTLGEAISIAKASNIKSLIVGHYSSRYADPQVFLDEGLGRFSGLMLGEEGRTYNV